MIKKALLVLCATSTFMISSSALAEISCEAEVEKVNQLLGQQGLTPIRDTSTLIGTIRTFDKTDRLPIDYVTSQEAKKMGWSGDPKDSLWFVWALNKKIIGGDAYSNANLPSRYSWISVDLDSVRGMRSDKKLILSETTRKKFITTNNYRSFVELAPCR